MKEKLFEQLSALMDGELPAGEQDLLLRRLSSDPELQQRWDRYHIVRDALRGGLPAQAHTELTADIAQALKSEQPIAPGKAAGLPTWAKPLAGLAVAASVAMLAVLTVKPENPAPQIMPLAGVPALPASVVPEMPLEFARIEGLHWDVEEPEVANQLNQYLTNHNEYAATGGVQGMLPYARTVGYDGQ